MRELCLSPQDRSWDTEIKSDNHPLKKNKWKINERKKLPFAVIFKTKQDWEFQENVYRIKEETMVERQGAISCSCQDKSH